MGRLRLADTDSGKSAGSDEEHEWLTELCRAGRAGAEPPDSDDEWLKELCRAPANSTTTELRSASAAGLGGDPTRSSPSAESELTSARGFPVAGLDAEQTGSRRNSGAPRLATAEPIGPCYGALRGPDLQRLLQLMASLGGGPCSPSAADGFLGWRPLR